MARPSNSREAKELYELKQKAVQYYSENGVPKKMEEILNNMFYDDPEDVYGHVCNFFEGYSKTPTITKVRAIEALDSRGQPTIQTEVYCKVKNFEKLVVTSTCSSSNSLLSEAAKLDDVEEETKQRHASVTKATTYINDVISEKLLHLDPVNLTEADKIVSNVIETLRLEQEAKEQEEQGDDKEPTPAPQPTPPPSKKGKSPTKDADKKGKGPPIVIIPDEPLEKLFCGCDAICGVSQAICQTGAALRDVPLYEHIAQTRLQQVPNAFTLPIPMVTMLQSGKAAPGKLNCVKEFMVTPKPGMPIADAIKHMTNIYHIITKQLFIKSGDISARFVNDYGSVVPTLDRVEQGLDMIQDAMLQLELTPGEDFHIVINSAAHECFDFDKGKYEVLGGQQKLAGEVVDFWVELLARYPAVIGLIDPLRKQDKENWMKLCDSVTERLFIIGSHVYHRPGLLKDEETNCEEFKTSGIMLGFELMTSVSDMMSCQEKMRQENNVTIVATNQGDSPDTFIVDLAVGLEATFIKLGAPCRGERVSKLNRLQQISRHLSEQEKIKDQSFYEFPHISPPPPPEGEEVPEPEPEDTKKKKVPTATLR